MGIDDQAYNVALQNNKLFYAPNNDIKTKSHLMQIWMDDRDWRDNYEFSKPEGQDPQGGAVPFL